MSASVTPALSKRRGRRGCFRARGGRSFAAARAGRRRRPRRPRAPDAGRGSPRLSPFSFCTGRRGPPADLRSYPHPIPGKSFAPPQPERYLLHSGTQRPVLLYYLYRAAPHPHEVNVPGVLEGHAAYGKRPALAGVQLCRRLERRRCTASAPGGGGKSASARGASRTCPACRPR